MNLEVISKFKKCNVWQPKIRDSHTRHIHTIYVRQVISMQSKGVANAAGYVASVKNNSFKINHIN